MKSLMISLVSISVACALVFIAEGVSAETRTYKYDSKGRLVKVEKSGGQRTTPTVATYAIDKANNRKRVQVTGASR